MKEKMAEILIQCLPYMIALLSCIIMGFKVMGGINEWKGSINESNLNQVSKDMKAVVKRNLELQNQLQKLLNENEEVKKSMQAKIDALLDEIEALKKKAEENIDKKEE